jgi:hypothetical protein
MEEIGYAQVIPTGYDPGKKTYPGSNSGITCASWGQAALFL